MSDYGTPDYTDGSSIPDINLELNKQNIRNAGRKKSPVWDYFEQYGPFAIERGETTKKTKILFIC